MNDLISRSAAIEAFEMRKSTFESMPSSVSNMVINAIVMCKTVVETAPAIDSLPVVHARWVRDDLMNARCSNCSERLPFIHCYSEETDEEWDDEIDETPWCMHCGARMDGESDD